MDQAGGIGNVSLAPASLPPAAGNRGRLAQPAQKCYASRGGNSGSTMHRSIEGAAHFKTGVHWLLRHTGNPDSRPTPFAPFIACPDSRVVPEVLPQREPGEIFVVRNAGNIVPSYGPPVHATPKPRLAYPVLRG